VVLHPVAELGEQVPANLRMRELPATEADGDLDPVPVLEELDRAVDLGLEVPRADLRRQADLLELHRPLLPLRLLLPLGQLVLVLTVVEELDDRGCRGGRDLDKVEALVLRHLQGLLRGHDAQL